MNRQAFLTHLAIEAETLDVWLDQAWLAPTRDATDFRFTEIDVARGRLIQDLVGGFGVNEPGVDVILHLVDQLHGLRRALAGLPGALQPGDLA